MPFGKHRGREVHRMPKGYLRWMLANCDLSPELRRAVEDGLEGIAYTPPKPVDVDALVHKICKPWEEQSR